MLSAMLTVSSMLVIPDAHVSITQSAENVIETNTIHFITSSEALKEAMQLSRQTLHGHIQCRAFMLAEQICYAMQGHLTTHPEQK